VIVKIARFSTGSDPRFGILDEEEGHLVVLSGDPMFSGYETTGERVPLADARLLAPVIPRSKVVAVGRNYAAHAAEHGSVLKPNTSVVGPDDVIRLPADSQRVEHEGELAVVIGRITRDASVEDAARSVFGYTIGNDVTARDIQHSESQWARAKGYDTFCPLGPWIETEGAFEDALIETRVDGELRQSGRTSEMVHSVAELIAFASRVWTLLPGDVILTGTPAGVGPFADGQVVEVSIEGIGTLSNPARARA
jgi:2-keto-4-pentenoate hydratase/2-oxohepta-3-ene-1,7-dioic acid hydratase in catechol pathway